MNTCPKCNRDDQIQKLSSIVASNTRTTAGTSTTSNRTTIAGRQKFFSKHNRYTGKGDLSGEAYSLSETAINTIEQSNLAQKVMPPPKPIEPTPPNISILDRLDSVQTGAMLGLGIIGGFLGYGSALALWEMQFHIAADLLEIPLPVVGLVLGAFFGYKLAGNFRKRKPIVSRVFIKQEAYAQELNLFKQKLSEWEMAYSRWNELYYCFRDDIVYHPGTSETITPEKTLELCYN